MAQIWFWASYRWTWHSFYLTVTSGKAAVVTILKVWFPRLDLLISTYSTFFLDLDFSCSLSFWALSLLLYNWKWNMHESQVVGCLQHHCYVCEMHSYREKDGKPVMIETIICVCVCKRAGMGLPLNNFKIVEKNKRTIFVWGN